MTLKRSAELSYCLLCLHASSAATGIRAVSMLTAGSLLDADPSPSGMATNLATAQAVFSVTVEGDLLADSANAPASAEPLTDWRLVVAPTLVVQNLLPVRGTFLVWEQPQACPRYSCTLLMLKVPVSVHHHQQHAILTHLPF